jgi:hypothetical protein
MRAAQVVNSLLEEEPDFDPQREMERYTATMPFDQGAADILQDARALYLRWMANNSIPTLRKERPQLDDESIAQAVLRRAIERRGSPGAKNAYRRLRQLSYYDF